MTKFSRIEVSNITNRAKSSYAYIKRYLSRKKIEGDLFSTIAAIEASINAQISNIVVETAREQDSTPLDVDQKVFWGVFGVVTWLAL